MWTFTIRAREARVPSSSSNASSWKILTQITNTTSRSKNIKPRGLMSSSVQYFQVKCRFTTDCAIHGLRPPRCITTAAAFKWNKSAHKCATSPRKTRWAHQQCWQPKTITDFHVAVHNSNDTIYAIESSSASESDQSASVPWSALIDILRVWPLCVSTNF